MPFLHDLLALKRPSGKWGPGGNWVGCKMACFGWNTHPSAQGSSTLTPLSLQDSPLDPFRGVSSCEGPGGQTWKNTCKARARLRVSPRPPAHATRHARLRHLPLLCCSKTRLLEEGLGIPGTHGLLKVSVGTQELCRWVVTLQTSQHSSARSGYKPLPSDQENGRVFLA